MPILCSFPYCQLTSPSLTNVKDISERSHIKEVLTFDATSQSSHVPGTSRFDLPKVKLRSHQLSSRVSRHDLDPIFGPQDLNQLTLYPVRGHSFIRKMTGPLLTGTGLL